MQTMLKYRVGKNVVLTEIATYIILFLNSDPVFKLRTTSAIDNRDTHDSLQTLWSVK